MSGPDAGDRDDRPPLQPTEAPSSQPPPVPRRRRGLRAILAADVAGFSGRMSVSETGTVASLSEVRKVALRQIRDYGGWLFGMPGDGLFVLFESAVDAMRCALDIQQELAANENLGGMRLRIGVHLGEVLFDDELPYGEALNIAARLEALADPGGILVSATVFDAVSARVSARFEERGRAASQEHSAPHRDVRRDSDERGAGG